MASLYLEIWLVIPELFIPVLTGMSSPGPMLEMKLRIWEARLISRLVFSVSSNLFIALLALPSMMELAELAVRIATSLSTSPRSLESSATRSTMKASVLRATWFMSLMPS